jgi:hypothetical protein
MSQPFRARVVRVFLCLPLCVLGAGFYVYLGRQMEPVWIMHLLLGVYIATMLTYGALYLCGVDAAEWRWIQRLTAWATKDLKDHLGRSVP